MTPYIALIAFIVSLTPMFGAQSQPIAYEEGPKAHYFANADTVLVGKASAEPSYSKANAKEVYVRTVTAYTSAVEETDDTPFITASGNHVRVGTAAANWLPFGTAIRIPEYFGEQVFVIEDRMNRKHPHKVDIWFPEKKDALNFGKRTTVIEVL
jgi:3D (Asp-Asp-Asp) domain-containing protein